MAHINKGHEPDQVPPGGDPAGAPEDPPPDFQPSELPLVPGYEFVGNQVHEGETDVNSPDYISPPAYQDVCQASLPSYEDATSAEMAHISETEARTALIEHMDQTCCYGTKAAEELVIDQIIPFNAFHYRLESYIEMRKTYWRFKPYNRGGPVDGPLNGPAPQAWDIVCSPGTMFVDQTVLIEIPHTSYVKPCGRCFGTGFVRCTSCLGIGTQYCYSCSGRGSVSYTDGHGRVDYRRCGSCCGSGRMRCSTCFGRGRIVCFRCSGCGLLRHFLELRVDFKNKISDHVIDRSDFGNRDNLITTAGGKVILNQTAQRLAPINEHEDRELCGATAALHQAHVTLFLSARLLMQRQMLRVVPVSKCSYTWREKPGCYWVYGTERKVEAPDYPCCCSTCCCCVIL